MALCTLCGVLTDPEKEVSAVWRDGTKLYMCQKCATKDVVDRIVQESGFEQAEELMKQLWDLLERYPRLLVAYAVAGYYASQCP